MAVAITITINEGEGVDIDNLEDTFARYFKGMEDGTFEETDTVQFVVITADPELPNAIYDFVPLAYLGYSGSYPEPTTIPVEDDSMPVGDTVLVLETEVDG